MHPAVRTRFAPSPTGYLHIGGARTALFAWAYARHHHGTFVLRIEDTDLERSTPESVQAILDGMRWLGLDYDEGPFYQMQRMPRYKEVLAQMLAQGQAYYCYATPQELDDLIIARSDGTPTYNFCVVDDDWDMRITHVIRGDDHVNNTPRQINILKALGAELPHYAHVPMILGEDGERLSKRHGAVSVLQYQQEGFLPAALLNYLARLGWSHGDDELFSLQQFADWFALDAINRAPAKFNTDKLRWLNQQYIKSADASQLAEALTPFLAVEGLDTQQGPALTDVVHLLRERAETLVDLARQARIFYHYQPPEADALAAHLDLAVLPALQDITQRLATLSWQPENIHDAIKSCVTQFELKMPKLAMPLRLMTTGTTHTPGIDKTLFLIGKDTVLRRLREQTDKIATR